MRTQLFADPTGIFLHDAILDRCARFANKTAIVDTSACESGRAKRISYAEYAELVTAAARGLVAAGLHPGERVGIYLPNSWEFCVAYHAATLAGGVPSPINPNYRERELRHQVEDSGAAMLVSNGPQISGIDLRGFPNLRNVYTTREHVSGSRPFAELLRASQSATASPSQSAWDTVAALPYSSGTTGLSKGVMLTHSNLLTNAYQFLAPGEAASFNPHDAILCFLPLYHIYGLNVILNPTLIAGGTLVLMARFDPAALCKLITDEEITFLPMVPPALNAMCLAAEQGIFATSHKVRAAKSGAAPLAPELARRFTSLTGIPVKQGYGMTEASPVTHCGFIEAELYLPESIGLPLAQTDCRVVCEDGTEARGEAGELVMRGPQFMLGYWQAPEATAEVLRDGWYWSGDVARMDERGFFTIVDRRKELIKYKGFSIAPAEVEAVLLEHPKVQDCGVVGRMDDACGEVPCAFIVVRAGSEGSAALERELCGYVGERLIKYKQPREIRFVSSIPRNPSGKILRRELRSQL